jgi:hypothetical protein
VVSTTSSASDVRSSSSVGVLPERNTMPALPLASTGRRNAIWKLRDSVDKCADAQGRERRAVLAQGCKQFFACREDALGMVQRDVADFGQHQFAPNPFEQGMAQALFKVPDLH